MTNEKAKYLQKRGDKWSMYYRLPDNLLTNPAIKHSSGVFFKALGTSDLKRAKRLRDDIIYELNQVDDSYTACKKLIAENSKTYVPTEKHSTYESYIKHKIISDAGSISIRNKTDLISNISSANRLVLDVVAGKNPDNANLIKTLLGVVVSEKTANLKAKKTISLIKRGVAWFLEHVGKDDYDVAKITFDQLSEYIAIDRDDGASGSTICGYLYGIRQIWKRAKRSKFVSGECPCDEHGIEKNTESYDPYTYKEIYEMHDKADNDMKLLIHAAAVTGARVGELLTCEVKTPSTVDFKCFFFKFKDKGKNEQSTRVVPVHSSLDLPEGFKFNYSASVVSREFKKVKDAVIKDIHDECTGKDRLLVFHSFRSTVCTYLVFEKNISERVVGSISGHLAGAKINGSLNSYIHPTDLKLKKDVVELIKWK